MNNLAKADSQFFMCHSSQCLVNVEHKNWRRPTRYDSSLIHEHVREETDNLGSDQVRHKPDCTVTEDG